jgi:hypothetical protein
VPAERHVLLFAAALGVLNVLVALFALPYSPGLDDPSLYTSVYSYQHYGQLCFPYDDAPFMYKHAPTKYWIVGLLVSAGLPLRLVTAGLFLASYFLVLGASRACRLTFFRRLAVLFAVPAVVTLCPFISYSPENLTHGEAIGRLRPDDLVLTFWLSGLFWLEASRRGERRAWHGLLGGACIGLASVTHWFGLSALAAVVVYLAASRLAREPGPGRRDALVGLGLAAVLLPFLIATRPYWPNISALIASQGGERGPGGLASAWAHHVADFWFLHQWMKLHLGEVWPATALLAVPVKLALPPLVVAAPVLLTQRATRVFGLAALSLPLAVLGVNHKSIGYELPEIALFMLALGWLLAGVLERIAEPRFRLLASTVFLVPIATASPAVWQPRALRFMDQSYSLDLLRAVGRTIVGPGATVVGRFYTGGADNWVLAGHPRDPGIDFAVTREFDLYSEQLHGSYRAGRTRVRGFVLAPDMPSASLVYFKAGKSRAPVAGFLLRDGRIARFSESRTGWKFSMLSCQATTEELPWVWPQPPAAIAGYIPRSNHCVAETASAIWPNAAASVLLRRTRSFTDISAQVLVALLVPSASDTATEDLLRARCHCVSLQETSGGLSDVRAHHLLSGLKKTDSVIRFYATSSDFAAGRTMTDRFAEQRRSLSAK